MKREYFVFSTIFFLTLILALTLPVVYGSEEEIKVNIIFENVFGLYGFELKVSYDTNALDLIATTPQLPWTFYYLVKDNIDESKGVYSLTVAALPPSPPYSGTIKIVELTFQPVAEIRKIRITEVKLVDKNGNSIPFEIDGFTVRGLPVHDVSVKKVLACPRSAYQGDPISISVEVENQGNFEETFDVIVYADHDGSIIGDEIIVGTQTVNIAPKTTAWLNFTWDTTGVPYGGYYISAKLSIVPEENDISDNFLEKADYVGGIYPRPYVRQTAETLAQALLVCLMGLAIFAGTFYVKSYWFSC